MEPLQRTPLELYDKLVDAYQQAGVWPLFKHAYIKSGNKWRSKGWFWIISIITLAVIVYLLITVIEHILDRFSNTGFSVKIFITIFSIFIVEVFVILDLRKKIKRLFKEEIKNYCSLAKTYAEGWEIYRYILFRDKINQTGFKPENVKQVKLLLDLDQRTLGSYVAQRPLTVWTASTLTAIIAGSVQNWNKEYVVLAVIICIMILVVLWFLPMFINKQRRQYELHRWLDWYEADTLKLMTANFDGADSSLD